MARNVKKLRVEIADTNDKREKGLMFRKSMPDDQGMLFKFPQKRRLSFWMKNTYIPLDIAFLDADGYIQQISKMDALSSRSIMSDSPCQYALEVNQGWFDKHGVGTGQKVKGLCFAQYMALDFNTGEITPDIYIMRTFEEKIEYAEERGLAIEIVYRSKNGHALPPRRLQPLPDPYPEAGKYPRMNGQEGKLFKAFDISPSIVGSDYEIEGNSVKSYLFDGIIQLDIIGLDGRPINMIRGIPESEPAPTPEDMYNFDVTKEGIVYQIIKDYIPTLTVEQWNMVKDDIKDMLAEGISIVEIADTARRVILESIEPPKDFLGDLQDK